MSASVAGRALDTNHLSLPTTPIVTPSADHGTHAKWPAVLPLASNAVGQLGGAVAVRSSGVAEDMADASFAGQYETVLDVRAPLQAGRHSVP